MKTISEINSKAWYRFLKVTYILFAIVCYVSIISLAAVHTNKVIDDYSRYNQQQYESNQRLVEINKLKYLGQNTDQILDLVYGDSFFRNLTMTRKEFVAVYGEEKGNKLSLIPEKEKEEPLNYLWLILLIPLYILFAFSIPEILRRIFYYIYFGKIRPKKN